MSDTMDIYALLGLWMFMVLQFGKGKAWDDKWTIYLSLFIPFVLAAVPVSGNEMLINYATGAAKLFLYGTGAWAIKKASEK